MKKIISFVVISLIALPAFAVSRPSQSRNVMENQTFQAAPRATASTNQITAMANLNATSQAELIDKSSIRVPVEDVPSVSVSGGNENNGGDNNNSEYEKQKAACLNNNIGIGNTFVWASRYSNTNNYASMVEDVANPENNVCFVLVGLKSNDSRISVSDIPEKYFQMGQNITCGSWADADMLRQRILDAKKSGRAWATVGGAVGGAGLGVGVMELFGNRLIGGDVMGQKALQGDAQLIAQLRALKNQDRSSFDQIISALETLQKECDSWEGDNKPAECTSYNYEYLLNAKN